jgi:hypothetical protein
MERTSMVPDLLETCAWAVKWWRPDCVAGVAGFEPLHFGIRIREDSQPGAAGFEPLHLKIGIAKTLSSGREDIDYSENLRVLVDELRANAAKNGEQS